MSVFLGWLMAYFVLTVTMRAILLATAASKLRIGHYSGLIFATVVEAAFIGWAASIYAGL